MPEVIEKFYSLKELWKKLPKLPVDRKYLAGGTDLIVGYNLGISSNECYLDISDIRELNLVRENKKQVFIGAGVKLAELGKNSLIKRWVPALYDCVPHFASSSLRNMATLGGNLANASPSADGVCALAASRAWVLLNLYGKRESKPVLSVLKGPKKNALKKDQIIEGFIVPKKRHKAVFLKLISRAKFGIGKVGICVCADIEKKFVKDINVVLSSVAPTVFEAKKTSSILKYSYLTAKIVEKASETIRTEVSPISDIRSAQDYRREMCGVLLERALRYIA